MKIPHPGELRQLVEIGKTVNIVNENGFPVETEQVVCQVWAKAEDCDSRYFTAGDAENTERSIWFTIRWRSDGIAETAFPRRDSASRFHRPSCNTRCPPSCPATGSRPSRP